MSGRITEQEIRERLVGRPIDVVFYSGRTNDTSSRFRCLTAGCDHVWTAAASLVVRGGGCPKCSGKLPVTEAIVRERLAVRNIELLCYAGKTSEPTSRFRCLVPGCGHVWSARASGIFSGKGCQKCAGNKQITKAEVLERIAGRGIALVHYAGKASDQTSRFRCLAPGCGHVWSTGAGAILRGHGCQKCAGSLPMTEMALRESLTGRGIDLLWYSGRTNTLKSRFRCLVSGCGHVWSTTATSVLQGKGCQKCCGRLPLTEATLRERIKERGFEITEYGGNVTKPSRFRCTSKGCGHEWVASFDNVDGKKTGCPACSKYGFDPSRGATVYAYKIQTRHREYLGFGITNDFKKRDGAHQRTFKKHGVSADLVFSYNASGVAVQGLERRLKEVLPIFDTGIKGFRTEAILWDQQGVDKLQRVARLLSEQFPQNPAN